MAISKATITVPSLYSISWSDNVTEAGGCMVNGLGKFVYGVDETCVLLANV